MSLKFVKRQSAMPPNWVPPHREETWTKVDGTSIKVGDMDEEHARNALRLCIRFLKSQPSLSPPFNETWESFFKKNAK